MNEANYQKVVAALPDWKPSRKVRVFGVSAIQEIVVDITFLDAWRIVKRLSDEGLLSMQRWRVDDPAQG